MRRHLPGYASVPGGQLTQASYLERTNLGDALEIPVDVDDAKVVKQCCFGDQQVRDGDAVPKPVMVRKVALESDSAVEDVFGRCHDFKVVAQQFSMGVIFSS